MVVAAAAYLVNRRWPLPGLGGRTAPATDAPDAPDAPETKDADGTKDAEAAETAEPVASAAKPADGPADKA